MHFKPESVTQAVPERLAETAPVNVVAGERVGIVGANLEDQMKPLPDAVAAFVRWLVEESGWRVTERERPGEAAASPMPATRRWRRISRLRSGSRTAGRTALPAFLTGWAWPAHR